MTRTGRGAASSGHVDDVKKPRAIVKTLRVTAFLTGVVLLAATAWSLGTSPSADALQTFLFALFALVAFLGSIAEISKTEEDSSKEDKEDSGRRRLRFPLRERWEQLVRPLLGVRYRRMPALERHEFHYPTQSSQDRHKILVLRLQDRRKSGLLKSVVHVSPGADPYDVLVFDGATASVRIQDFNADGRPELFVDYVAGAHTHYVEVFRLDEFERFVPLSGSGLVADWGPVVVRQDAKNYVIDLKIGSDADGENARVQSYVISETSVELQAREEPG